MNHWVLPQVERQLLDRRAALHASLQVAPDAGADLVRLLQEVDKALERLPTSDYGRCVVCGGEFDESELQANPLRRYCLCDLNEYGRAGLERDLQLAWEVQASLLPPQNLEHAGWSSHYRYRPAGVVSGDYCELQPVAADSGDWLYFFLGDVSGKGVAAAYWMAHLSALVRRSLAEAPPVSELLAIVNRHLLERGSSTHYATLVAGRADRRGRVELCNAGHCRPLLLQVEGARELTATNLPLGLNEENEFEEQQFELSPGDSLLLYSDGISEAENAAGQPFGAAGVCRAAVSRFGLRPPLIAGQCLLTLQQFLEGASPRDDVSLLVLQFGESI